MHQTMHVEHNSHKNMMETEFPIAFLLNTFMDTQRKWSTTEQEAYRVYYSSHQKELLLHQGAEGIICNDHKTTGKISQWKECQQQSKQMGIRTSNI